MPHRAAAMRAWRCRTLVTQRDMRLTVPLLRATCLQGIEVSLGVQPVLPLLVEDDLQAFTHRVAAGFRPAGPLDRFGMAA